MLEQSASVPAMQSPLFLQVIWWTLVWSGPYLQSCKAKKTGQRPSTSKVVAEWRSDRGTRFLVQTRFETIDNSTPHKREHYETKEVSPNVIEAMDVLEAWREFQETRPNEWEKHNDFAQNNWEKEKSAKRQEKVKEGKIEESLEREDGNAWCFPSFRCLFPIWK